MARCHLVYGLIAIHLCLALSYGGFEYNPALIPQAPGYYPQYLPPNPYANQYAPGPNPYYANQYEPQQGYGSEQEDPQYLSFLDQTQDTGAAPTTPADSTTASDTAVVQTPQDTANSADSTASSSPPTPPPTNSNMDPLDIQLEAALEAVKADMISKGKQVLEEKQWTDDVKAVIEQYTKKISNVYGNIEKLKKDMGELYQKKQRIINAKIQKSLTAKLKDSKSDLQTVQAALDKVTNTQMEFEQSKKDIQATIDSIFTQLAELKGQPAPAAAGASGEGGGATGEDGGEDGGGGQEAAAGGSASTPADAADSSDDDTDTVDKTAEINSKIDTIKSIVSALNKGSSSSA